MKPCQLFLSLRRAAFRAAPVFAVFTTTLSALTVESYYARLHDVYGYSNTSFGIKILDVDVVGPLSVEMWGERSLPRFPHPPNGLNGFDTSFTSAGLGISADWSYLKVGIRGTVGDVVRFGRLEGAATISGKIPLLRRFRLMPGWESSAHVAEKSAFADVMGMRAHSHHAELGFGMKLWEAWVNYDIELIDGVDSTTYGRYMEGPDLYLRFGNPRFDAILQTALDSANIEINPIPANRINQFSAYFFGPAFPFLYVGGYYTLTKCRRDNIIPTAQYTIPAPEDAYTALDSVLYLPTADFPYKSRKQEWALGVSVSVLGTFSAPRSPLSGIEGKIDFPILSGGRYKGYYYAETLNLLSLYLDSFEYDYSGLGPLKAGAKAHKRLPFGLVLSGSYSFFAEPYTAENNIFERYFGPDVYRYHEFSIQLGWTPSLESNKN